MFLVLIILIGLHLQWTLAYSTSSNNHALTSDSIAHLTNVSLTHLNPSDIQLDIAISGTSTSHHFSNLNKRWYVLSNPQTKNNVNDQLKHVKSQYGHWLYKYLTTNSTIREVPPDQNDNSLNFRFYLSENNYLNEDGIEIFHLDKDGNMVKSSSNNDYNTTKTISYKGQAFRRFQYYNLNDDNQELKYSQKHVGWARLTITYDSTSRNLNENNIISIKGSWHVSDTTLGSIDSLYSIDSINNFRSSHYNDEITSNSIDEKQYENDLDDEDLIVWRDVDMDRNFDFLTKNILNDDYDFNKFESEQSLINTKKETKSIIKRELDYFNTYSFNNHINDNNNRLIKRSGDDSDTGNSGSAHSNLYSLIGSTNGCPKFRKFVMVGVAVDCNFIANYNNNQSQIRENVISLVNTASEVYDTSFNITLGLKQLVLVNSSTCSNSPSWNVACSSMGSISERLNEFTTWRAKQTSDTIGVWSLLTDCAQDSVVGLSWMSTLCEVGTLDGSNSTIAATNVISHTPYDWAVYSHEVGHTFGAVHDCTSDTCSSGADSSNQCCPLSSGTCSAGGKYIMNPSTGAQQSGFSSCSIGNICDSLTTMNSTCVVNNKDVTGLVTEGICGNGIVEDGEECDCGGTEGCAQSSSKCCDPTTCKFINSATCDDINDSCCDKCQYASSSTICESSIGPCSPVVYCNGNSSQCPSQTLLKDGTTCSLSNSSSTDLKCASGYCTSRDLQCVTIFGSMSVSTTLSNGTSVSLNITESCGDDSSCSMGCRDSRFPNVCFRNSQNYLDGTVCGSTGSCSSGRCKGGKSSFFGNDGDRGFLGSWASNHKTLLIGILAGVGGLLLVLFLISLIRKSLRPKPTNQVIIPMKPMMPPPSYSAQPPQQPYYNYNNNNDYYPQQHNGTYNNDYNYSNNNILQPQNTYRPNY